MNQVTVIDPFADVFPGLLRGFVSPTTRVLNGQRPAATQRIRVDVAESDEAYTVHADMPGVSKEDIDVQIDGAQVAISAKLAQRAEVEGETVLRTERFVGEMSRSFSLGSDLDEDGASASFENGVLVLTLPKKKAPASKRLTIN
ncbi:MAG: Hsp20/alpha crystallin family protein [Burkholderiaceae bacterium]